MLISIIKAVVALGIMGLAFGAILSLAARFFSVKEDERKAKILDCLPSANCGGCGFAGCSAYADAVVAGEAEVNKCPVGGADAAQKIGEIMGVSAGDVVKKTAFIRCLGSHDNANHKYKYYGLNDCAAASKLLDGYMSCKYGCLGFGNCERVCPVNAIKIENGVAIIDKEICVACGACVSECPKKIIDIVPSDAKYTVSCSSTNKGPITRDSCGAGCIGCKICEKACEAGAITVNDFLAKIDYEKCTNCGACVEKCPRKIIKMK